jgi:copper chaperone CopZ
VLEHYARPDCDGLYRLTLVLENVHCAACAWLIHRFVGALEGVAEIRVDVTDGRAHLQWNPERTPLSEIAARLAALGYRPHLDSPMAGHARNKTERRQMLKYIVVAGLGMMQVMSYALAKYIGAVAGPGSGNRALLSAHFHGGGRAGLPVRRPDLLQVGLAHPDPGRMGMDVPVAAAMLLALFSSVYVTLFSYGHVYFDSVVMFIFFLLLGRYAVLVARQNAGQLHSALARSLPVQARRLTTEGSELVTLVELEAGDRVQVAAGETLPADGIIESGNRSWSMSRCCRANRCRAVGSSATGPGRQPGPRWPDGAQGRGTRPVDHAVGHRAHARPGPHLQAAHGPDGRQAGQLVRRLCPDRRGHCRPGLVADRSGHGPAGGAGGAGRVLPLCIGIGHAGGPGLPRAVLPAWAC